VPSLPHSAGACAVPLPEPLSELASLLERDLALYICLEPRGAVFSVKSREMVAFGETLIAEWARLSPQDRARQVIDWIRRASAYCQSPRIRWMSPGIPERTPTPRSA